MPYPQRSAIPLILEAYFCCSAHWIHVMYERCTYIHDSFFSSPGLADSAAALFSAWLIQLKDYLFWTWRIIAKERKCTCRYITSLPSICGLLIIISFFFLSNHLGKMEQVSTDGLKINRGKKAYEGILYLQEKSVRFGLLFAYKEIMQSCSHHIHLE